MKLDLKSTANGLLMSVLCLLAGCSSDGLPHSGSWRVINYWAIWCTPCREEIPELNTLNQQEDIVVLGINYDGKSGDALAEQATALGIAFPQLADDPSQRLGTRRPKVLPTTLLVSPDGKLLTTLTGPQTAETLLTTLNALGRSG